MTCFTVTQGHGVPPDKPRWQDRFYQDFVTLFRKFIDHHLSRYPKGVAEAGWSGSWGTIIVWFYGGSSS